MAKKLHEFDESFRSLVMDGRSLPYLPEPIYDIIKRINDTPLTLQLKSVWTTTIKDLFSAENVNVKTWDDCKNKVLDAKVKLNQALMYADADDLQLLEADLFKDAESINNDISDIFSDYIFNILRLARI